MIVYKQPVKHPSGRLKVAFLTGLSQPFDCRLSAVQYSFMARLSVPEKAKVYLNFPYLASQEEHIQPPLWRASMANARQFLLASRTDFKQAARAHLAQFVASAEKVVLLVGSCGLEIFNHAFQAELASKVSHVFAFGPVAQQAPVVPHTLIQGRQDYLSKYFFRHVDVQVPGQGHMDYLRHQKVFDCMNEGLTKEGLCSNILSS